jgi:hypothetical protein
MKITDASAKLFLEYAKDAGNWSGCPLVDGNAGERGNLTQLKRAGLVMTKRDEEGAWLFFTPAGIAYAATVGVDLSWIK